MMSHDDDPKDGPAVAATVFGAVVVYAVGTPLILEEFTYLLKILIVAYRYSLSFAASKLGFICATTGEGRLRCRSAGNMCMVWSTEG